MYQESLTKLYLVRQLDIEAGQAETDLRTKDSMYLIDHPSQYQLSRADG